MTGTSERRTTLLTEGLARLGDRSRVGTRLGPSLDLLRVGREFLGVRRDAAAVQQWSARVRRDTYRRIWDDAAARLGAVREDLGPDFTRISRGEVSTVTRYHEVMLDTAVHLMLALDKGVVHSLLTERGLPVSRFVIVDADDRSAGLDFVLGSEKPCVVKPLNASGGRGVTCGVDSGEAFLRAAVWARRWDPTLLVEEQALGQEIRFLFLDGLLIGILRRRPPALRGDGRSTVMQLIGAENRRRAGADGALGLSDLSIDLDTLLTLAGDNSSLHTVPDNGATVPVSTTANQSGADDTDRLARESVSAALIDEARDAVDAIGLRLGSVEVITPDPTRSLASARGVVLEVNGTPGLHYHYFVSNADEADHVAIPILATLLGDDPAAHVPDESTR